jgi:FkbM family methyltransferase
VNNVLRVTGFQLSRGPSLSRDIAEGRYGWLQDMKIATILDVGANVGQFAGKIREIIPDAMMYSFEPLEECFRRLTALSPSLSPVRCFQYALGESDGVVTMHKNDFSASSSIFPLSQEHREAYPFSRKTNDIQVTVRSLDSLAEEIALAPPLLLKADIQGYELNMLKGAERTLPLVHAVILETSFVELYEGQPLFHDIYQYLHDRGFIFAGSMEQVAHPANGIPLQADAVFRRV